jgi:hypothetical protein
VAARLWLDLPCDTATRPRSHSLRIASVPCGVVWGVHVLVHAIYV